MISFDFKNCQMLRRVATLLSPYGNNARDWGSLPLASFTHYLRGFSSSRDSQLKRLLAEKALREIKRDPLLQCLRDNSSNSRNKGIFLKTIPFVVIKTC